MFEGGHQILLRSSSPYRRLVKWVNGAWHWTGIVEPTGVDNWTKPFGTKQRWLLFTNSMADLCHENLSDEAILFALRTMWRARAHQWQVLTKRADRMANIMSRLYLRDGELHLAGAPLPPDQRYIIQNVWIGVSVENQAAADQRLPFLAATVAVVRFVSFEPLLGPIDLSHHVGTFNWAIVGGESGRSFRAMSDDWVRTIRDYCVEHHVPLFFKQRAGVKPAHSPVLDGATWAQLPKVELLDIPSDKERSASALWVAREYSRVFPARIDALSETSVVSLPHQATSAIASEARQ